MNDFKITEHQVPQKKFTAFIYDQEENDGGGWSCDAYETDGFVFIEYVGQLDFTFLNSVIVFLEYIAEVDVERRRSSLNLGASLHDNAEEFAAAASQFLLPVTGSDAHNVFVSTTVIADERNLILRTVTVLRVANRYQVLIGGTQVLSFNSIMLEAIVGLLKKFN